MRTVHEHPRFRNPPLSHEKDGDPHESHRVATPLELLFDLTFVIAFGLAVAIPVGAFLASVYALHTYLTRRFEPLHAGLLVGTAAVLTIAIIAVLADVPVPVCLVILTLAPAISVVGYEMLGYRRQAEALAHARRATVSPH